ncbi:MAG: TauD/TfdA family dioxygenase [Rhodospirillales bacterium]
MRADPQAWQVEPMTPRLGALVRGAHFDGAPNPETRAAVKALLDRHLVCVFADQSLDPAQLRDFTGAFGPIFLHHGDEGVLYAEGVPEVLEMRKEPDGKRLFGGSDWHADVTFQQPAGYLSILQAKIIPPLGGDTCFADTIAAFESLSPALQAQLRGLKALHSYYGPGGAEVPGLTALHPVVRRHPASGAEGLYLNRMFTTRFEGMTEAESRPLIHFLTERMASPEFTCRLRWHSGYLALWDNRFTLHYPINDFTGERRLLIRCTALESETQAALQTQEVFDRQVSAAE